VPQTIVVCRLRTVLELGRPRKTMACPTASLLYSYFLDTALVLLGYKLKATQVCIESNILLVSGDSALYQHPRCGRNLRASVHGWYPQAACCGYVRRPSASVLSASFGPKQTGGYMHSFISLKEAARAVCGQYPREWADGAA